MPLVLCPDCDRQVSDQAAACPGCARPMQISAPMMGSGTGGPAATRIPTPGIAFAQPSRACPSCGSDDTLTCETAWESGLSQIDTTGWVGGLGSFGLGGARTSQSGVAQTATSQRAAPPAKKGYGWKGWLALWFFGSLLMAGGRFFQVVVLALVIYGVYALIWNRTTWPRLHRHWLGRWLCRRCSTVFEPAL